VILNADENRVRRLAARQRMCLIRRRAGRGLGGRTYALTDAFGSAEPRARAFGFDEHGSPVASLEEIERYLVGRAETPAA
jgi:hypothetical protein